MIFAEAKPLSELIEKIRSHNTILIAGCATCVSECNAGGEREVQILQPLLSMAMKKAGHPVRIYSHTLEKQCESEFFDELSEYIDRIEAIISIACGIGIQALSDYFPGLPVYPGVNTTSLSIREEPGLWVSRCAACGDCKVDETFGICPIARCSKNLLNGPCGGTKNEGKCEVDDDMDCVWHLICERARSLDKLDSLKRVNSIRDWSGSFQTGPKRILRDELRS